MNQRGYNAMIGLAIGDALSWTSMHHRMYLLPAWTRKRLREMDTESESTHVIVRPMPFSLNQPAEYLDLGPTVSTEWAAFTAQTLLASETGNGSKVVLEAWQALARSEAIIRGGVSIQAALQNLRKGLLPPESGHDNPHYFDDGALIRSVPVGVWCSGNPAEAVRWTGVDSSVTNSEDGVWAAQAMAATVCVLCAGGTINDALKEGIGQLPEASWVRRVTGEALAFTENNGSIFSLLPTLQSNVTNREYSYGNAAPETLALAFAIARTHGDDFERAVTTAACCAKNAEVLPAAVGALVGAMQAGPIAGPVWERAVGMLRGICIPALAGKSYGDLSRRIAEHGIQKTDGVR